MNKKEMIDKYVNIWSGKWEPFMHEIDAPNIGGSIAISKAEFYTRAKELGWINGYKWGVEYPTNGKKPDLPDDLVIEWDAGDGWMRTECFNLAWTIDDGAERTITRFRIVEDRFKPKQPESHSKPSVDNSWHEKGELPPVGTVCYCYNGTDEWDRVTIVGIDGEAAVFNDAGKYNSAMAVCFRPFRSEREKFVDSAYESLCAKGFTPQSDDVDYFFALYDAGCRFVR